jgi:hypothetical protein
VTPSAVKAKKQFYGKADFTSVSALTAHAYLTSGSDLTA